MGTSDFSKSAVYLFFILMEYPIQIDAIVMELSILYFKLLVKISKKII